jgi:hypothetical protein
MSNPSVPDLLKDSSSPLGEDNEYFLVTIVDLDLSTTYPIQFRWKYKDASPSQDWSAVYNVVTQTSTVPGTPQLQSSDVSGEPGFIKVSWSGNDTSGNPITNIDRVDVHISGSSFGDGTTPSGNFKKAGTLTFAATPGEYIVQLKAYRLNGASSFFSTTRTVIVTSASEPIESPTNPNGFSSKRILAGIEVSWAGTYSTSTFSGFEAINIYAGNSSSATPGTFEQVGVLTGNNVKNTIVVSLGTYVVYGQPVYFHAAAVNKNGTVGTIQANVTNQILGPGKATDADINDGAVVISKLASDVLTVGNLKAGDINATSFIRAGTAGSARVEISSSTVGSVLPGLTVYDSSGTQLLRAPLTGGLTINGGGTFTGNLSAAGGTFTGALDIGTPSGGLYPFSVSSSGVLRAISGTIGGLTLSASSISNSLNTFALDSGGKARFGSSTGSAIIIDPAAGVGSAYIYHSSNGGTSASGNFIVSSSGILTATGGNFTGGTITNGSDFWNSNGTFRFGGSNGINYNGSSITLGSSGNPITINSSGNLSIGGTLTAGSIVLTNGDYWNIGSGFQLGGSSGIRFAGSTIFLGSSGNPVTINTSNGNVSIGGNLAASSVTINASTDFWTSSGFRLGGSNGINYSGSGTIALGSNTTISGNLSAPTGNIGSFNIGSTFLSSGSTDSDSFNYWSASTGVLSTTTLRSRASFGQTGLFMINGANILMNGGQISTGDGNISLGTGTLTLSNAFPGGKIQSGLGTILDIQSNGKIFTNNYIAVGTDNSSPSTLTEGVYAGTQLNVRRNADTPLHVHRYGGSGARRMQTFYLDGLGAGGINADGINTPVFASPSDYRLKENIRDFSGAMEKIKLTRLRVFNFKNNPDQDIVGFIAHELAEIDTNLATGTKDQIDKDGNPIYQDAMPGGLITYLTGALKEVIIKIEELEQRLDALEG